MTRSLYSDLAGSGKTLDMLSDEAFLGNLLVVEAALSRVAAPESPAAETIKSYVLDVADLSLRAAEGGNPLIPLVADLKAINPEGIHPGATSQDIIDSAIMLCLRDATMEIIANLGELAQDLAQLTSDHAETPIMGRTLGQIATATTFGAITAGWLMAVLNAKRKLKLLEFPVSYGGASGNMAAVYPHGWDIQSKLAHELNLSDPGWVWHSDRTPITEIAAALATAAGVVRKIAGDIVFYSQSEVGELREQSPGGSSAMPHKANPAAAIACDGYARRAPGLVATLFDALDCRLQRGTGSWHAEWATARELAAVTHAAVSRASKSINGIIVNVEVMASRVSGETGHAAELAARALVIYEREK
ncbi:3-carboxy-cis,cis-muconate cycloisomerase [Corynebacterium callunae]|uniref:3-carboxy-cis,cis-muconate cycloisomerase n=1 Tax=Corynebacterium callunae DSM 20147 TaxID=1121353 RepID=M1UZZ4_9CORY|nr:3-carboxy-cis,cis-muconate cycloisomerase [Corynebacterium callunae]AGG67453.1 3-carboxy-cis,cis-muconate cycloisomerase [Corynebacterium callunae DSM 20147]